MRFGTGTPTCAARAVNVLVNIGRVPPGHRAKEPGGAGPRPGQALILCAKARALLQGRFAATLDDIRALAPPVLRHRVLLNFNAEAENLTPDDAVTALLEAVTV